MLQYLLPRRKKRTLTTGEEGGADDDKATVETVRTEATRVHEPFMFSWWVFFLMWDLSKEEILRLKMGEIRRVVLAGSLPQPDVERNCVSWVLWHLRFQCFWPFYTAVEGIPG